MTKRILILIGTLGSLGAGWCFGIAPIPAPGCHYVCVCSQPLGQNCSWVQVCR